MDVRHGFLLFGVLCAFAVCQEEGGEETEPELHPLDGWYNNLIHPDWGAIDTVLLRKSPTAYADGVYHLAGPLRPNPFDISDRAHRGIMGFPSQRGRNAMMTYFGQQVVEEIMDVQRPGCPREFENIDVPRGHDLYDPPPNPKGNVQLPFLRSRYDFRTGQSPSNPRQQINEITPYIDGQLMYGPARAWTDAIREFKGGRLLARDLNAPIASSIPAFNTIRLPFANPPNPRQQTRIERLLPVNRFWRLGNPRGFENPFLLSFGIMWFRWHNYLAAEYVKEHNLEGREVEMDEAIFTEARKQVVAHHQKIVFYDWLPRWLRITKSGDTINNDFYPINETSTDPAFEPTCPYKGYDPNIHPGITHECQTSAMRFGHTLVTPGLWRRGAPNVNAPQNSEDFCNWIRTNLTRIPNESGQTHGFRLCNAYWSSQEAVEYDVDSLFRGMASTLAEQEDHIMVEDLAGKVFGPLEFSRRDLAAINIQRGRDHGLPDYNEVRVAFGLPKVERWEDINKNESETQNIQQVISDLRDLYIRTNPGLYNFTDPRGVDLFTGGLLETTFDGPGPLFRSILVDQFCRIRDGDRFWYENQRNDLFTQQQIDYINANVTLKYIIERVTNVQPSEIQDDVLIHRGPNSNDPCPQPAQLNLTTAVVNGQTLRIIESCTGWQTYDYFSGSEASFPLTFLLLALCIPLTVGIMLFMSKQNAKRMMVLKAKIVKKDKSSDPNSFVALEWVGPNSPDRKVRIKFDGQRRKIHVSDLRGKPLRMIDLRSHGEHIVNNLTLWLQDDKSQTTVSVRAEGEIDLVLFFTDIEDREEFVQKLQAFLQGLSIDVRKINMKEEIMMNNASTKEKRQKLLDKFFRVVSVQAFKSYKSDDMKLEQPLDQETAKQIANIQLTRTEFAEAFGLKPTSIFVRNMFMLVDSDKSGFVNFREFLDFFVVLSSDDAESKAQLIFNMYDIRQKGVLSKENFQKMIISLLDLSDTSLEQGQVGDLLSAMYRHANVREGSDMTFDDFKKIFASEEYAKTLEKATLNLDGMAEPQQQAKGARQSRGATFKAKRATMMKSYYEKEKKWKKKEKADRGSPSGHDKSLKRQNSVRVSAKVTSFPKTKAGQWWFEFTSFVATYQLLIFWSCLYTLVLAGVFVERAVYYSFEREHVGLRRIAGFGVTVTRGAASAMMFTYSALLITMSRNTITFFRETFLHRFFPWDEMHFLHKYIAGLALLFTLVHGVGHGINLYHISTQTSGDLNCIFREYFRATHVLASFHYWAYTTITGITGIILVLILMVMYVFALPYARRHVFKAFWTTHAMYVLVYIFSILHGSGRLVQAPLFHTYFIGPVVIYVIDKLISLSRNKVEIRILKAELLPSDVTALTFKRPLNFEYRSGQWVRVAALALGESEYHPFTLTSAPHEEHLSLHIRAVGPWTTNLRNMCNPDNFDIVKHNRLLYLDGAYGEGHQDWYRYKVAILVGGGIGVTPFASILKDIVHKSKIEDLRFPCKKVYFLWITRTQKQFEWMTDIIREVETVDSKNFVDVHIFITQFQEKFDFRTTMLYICERHFQKVAGKSLFTGLSAITHFGRPKFGDILRSISHEHQNVNLFGVFSCGPPPMTNELDRECSHLNKIQGAIFKHHFENF